MRKRINDKIKHHLILLSKSAESSFSPYFAEKVMNKIDDMEKKENKVFYFYRSLKTVSRKIAVVGAIVLLILISYNLKVGDNLSEEEVFYASEAVCNDLNKLPLF